jgi:hypothetical protein
MKTQRQLNAARTVGAKIVRQCCGQDGGLLNPRSSPHVFWLASQMQGEKRC